MTFCRGYKLALLFRVLIPDDLYGQESVLTYQELTSKVM